MGLFIFMQTAISNSTGYCLYGWIASGNTSVLPEVLHDFPDHFSVVFSYAACVFPTAVLTFLFSLLLEI